MKSIAASALIVSALAAGAPSSGQVVQCACAQPPGGLGRCESNQVALCKVSNGVCETSCFTVQRESGLFGGAQDPALAAAILSSLLAEKISEDEVRSDRAKATVKKLLSSRKDGTQYSFHTRTLNVTIALTPQTVGLLRTTVGLTER